MICLQCTNYFAPKNKNQRYCNLNCSMAYKSKNKTISRNCIREECDNTFYVRINSDPKKYCSRTCSAVINNKNMPKRSLEGRCKECSTSISASRVYCENHYNKNGVYDKSLMRKLCYNEECDNSFTTMMKNRKFCSKECNNHVNRKARKYDSDLSLYCKYCNGPKTPSSESCKACYAMVKHEHKISSWKNGDWNGGTENKLSNTIRSFLLEEAGYACEKCGFSEMHPDDSRTILEINHIDGNGSNHSPENLEVLCPNHHALTSSYRGRNVGKGRKVYYLRVTKE